MIDLQTIIQGGAVGIAVLVLLVFAYFLKLVFKFIGNHINHNTEAMTKFTAAITELSANIKRQNNK